MTVFSRSCRIVVCAWTVWTALSPSYAAGEVVLVDVATVTPWLGGRSLGKAGPYEKLQGRIYFEVDPGSSEGQRVTDIALAPRNAKGRVEFSGDFVLVRPRDPKRARHTALLEIPNRGLTQANGSLFATTRGASFDLMKLSATSLRDAFVFEQGFTVAWLGWQFDLPAGDIRLEAPVAPVNGPVRHSMIAMGSGGHQARLGGPNSYCAADAVQTDAKLLVRDRFDEAGKELPRAGWAFAHVEGGQLTPDPCAVFSRDELEPGRIYELIYRGAQPALAGLGEAAVSDFVDYLKYGGVKIGGPASAPREHPETLASVLGFGYSQSARFLRDFLYRGFNADEAGRQVFDGMFIASAGAGRGSFDHRYAMPGAAGNSVLSVLRPVDLFPFSDGVEDDPVSGARDGLLVKADASHTTPKIFYTYSSTEYWARAGSLAYTTVDGARELPLSESARLYFFAGTPHETFPFPPVKGSGAGAYANPGNFARADWLFRALLLDLDEWVTKGTAPPASAYPRLDKDLVSRERVEFPHIAGVSFPAYLPGNWRVDYGPEFAERGIIANEPPKVGLPYAVLVPRVNRDGNDLGGIELPEVAVPLGTFTGWNDSVPAMANLRYLAGLVGSFIPFPWSAKERKNSGDGRLSIEERYRGREDYSDKVRSAAERLVSLRLLRKEDVEVIVAENAGRWDYFASVRR